MCVTLDCPCVPSPLEWQITALIPQSSLLDVEEGEGVDH